MKVMNVVQSTIWLSMTDPAQTTSKCGSVQAPVSKSPVKVERREINNLVVDYIQMLTFVSRASLPFLRAMMPLVYTSDITLAMWLRVTQRCFSFKEPLSCSHLVLEGCFNFSSSS